MQISNNNSNMIYVLEGGYNLQQTALCASECVKVLLGAQVPTISQFIPDCCLSEVHFPTFLKFVKIYSPYWVCVAKIKQVLERVFPDLFKDTNPEDQTSILPVLDEKTMKRVETLTKKIIVDLIKKDETGNSSSQLIQ